MAHLRSRLPGAHGIRRRLSAASVVRFGQRIPRAIFRPLCRRRPESEFLAPEAGSLVVETALSLLLVLPMVFWLFEMCMLTYTYSVLGDAARQGVRYAMVHGTDTSDCSGPSSGCADSSGANVIAVVQHAAAYSFHDLTQMKVQVIYPDVSSSPPSRVDVTIDYTYVPYIKLPGIAQSIQLSAQGRIIY